MIGEVAAGWKLLAAAKQGFDALKKLQPEYGRFWKKFEAELKPEARDLPWTRLESLRVDPEFCGQACGLIRGDSQKRKQMRDRIRTLAVPPPGGRYDADEIVERVMRAANDSAVAAAKEDREVTAQRSHLLEGEIRELREEVGELRELLVKLQPTPPTTGDAQAQSQTRRPPEELAYESLQLPVPARNRERTLASRVEKKLQRILNRDPGVQEVLPSIKLRDGDRRYIPDFAIRNSQGVNWFVEVKGDHALQGAAGKQLRRLAELTQRAGQQLPGDWRFAVVTPSSLVGATSWSEVLANGAELPRS
jgi:hypothetical protein